MPSIEIRVQGRLTAHWSGWFSDLAVTPAGEDETVLTGPVIDQAELYGVLARLRDLGLALVTVHVTDAAAAPPPPGDEAPRIGRFYAGVSALIRRADGRYLVLRRSAAKDFGAGAWECVSGRVDQGEGFPEAVLREIREELGVAARINGILGTMHFYRGAARPENELVGVEYCCSIADPAAIRLSAEHAQARWVTAQEAGELLPADHWLLQAIRRAETLSALGNP